MRTRQQIYPCITPALRKRLSLYASKKGTSYSSVVEAALAQYLDGDASDRALLLRRLDRAEEPDLAGVVLGRDELLQVAKVVERDASPFQVARIPCARAVRATGGHDLVSEKPPAISAVVGGAVTLGTATTLLGGPP